MEMQMFSVTEANAAAETNYLSAYSTALEVKEVNVSINHLVKQRTVN